MSALPTHAADYDPVADAREHLRWIAELLDTAASLGDLDDDPPGLTAGYYQHGVTLVPALGRALQIAAGQAQRRCEAAARARGREECLICKRWLPQEQVILRSTGGQGERSNHWWACIDCSGPEAPALKGNEPR